jgi:hypothetical protein
MNIQEAAKEYADGQYEPTDRGILYRETQDDFTAGAEWHAKQSPWISIDDSFPEDNALVLCSSQIYGKVVLRWNKLAKEWLYPEENHIYCDWDKVDCWMYIPEV